MAEIGAERDSSRSRLIPQGPSSHCLSVYNYPAPLRQPSAADDSQMFIKY